MLNILFFTGVQKPCDDNRDFAILRFHGGPPYEVQLHGHVNVFACLSHPLVCVYVQLLLYTAVSNKWSFSSHISLIICNVVHISYVSAETFANQTQNTM